MRVDTASVLRVLAHELRSPAGVAQGYVKMALDGRLPNPADYRRALEQTRYAIERMSALGREASEIASWLERDAAPAWRLVNLKMLLDTALERDRGVDVSLADLDPAALVSTSDEAALTKALTSVLAAVAREAPGTRLTLTAKSYIESSAHIDFALGAPQVIPQLLSGPSAPGAGEIPLERGGLGLSLVMAVLVLGTHGVAVWTIQDQRAALGLRFPVETGQQS